MSEEKKKIKKRKTVHEIMSDYCDEIERLQPMPQEIQAYADLHEDDYGVVTYSKSKGDNSYFIRLHDTWRTKWGGRIHIDVGYVDENCADEPNVPDTTHLMLDRHYAADFVEFIKRRRKLKTEKEE